jgi:predicted RNase H-like HicB family nuclease
MKHFKITKKFDVEIEWDDNEEKERRYQAYCRELPFMVYAGTQAEALRKIRDAIDMFIAFEVNREKDDPASIRNIIEFRLGE